VIRGRPALSKKTTGKKKKETNLNNKNFALVSKATESKLTLCVTLEVYQKATFFVHFLRGNQNKFLKMNVVLLKMRTVFPASFYKTKKCSGLIQKKHNPVFFLQTHSDVRVQRRPCHVFLFDSHVK